MPQTLIQVDAFTDRPFTGNPAAVCLLTEPQPDRWLQQIAQEMNLSETAFVLPRPEGDGFRLRWFTPTTEVPLCGHATLATAHVLWSEGYLDPDTPARFHTQSGLLIATRRGDWIELNFPATPSTPVDVPSALVQALGCEVKAVYQNTLGYLVEVESAAIVRQMQPDFGVLATLPIADVIVTSQAEAGSGFDFISRFFAPSLGINEDPVTGAAHCCLAPFWRDRLHQEQFLAYQASARGGIVKVHYEGGDRVYLSGQAVTVMKAELVVSPN
ncbi:PhzF family phenazine biosynthesis protein [Trichothermofontia sp.]